MDGPSMDACPRRSADPRPQQRPPMTAAVKDGSRVEVGGEQEFVNIAHGPVSRAAGDRGELGPVRLIIAGRPAPESVRGWDHGSRSTTGMLGRGPGSSPTAGATPLGALESCGRKSCMAQHTAARYGQESARGLDPVTRDPTAAITEPAGAVAPLGRVARPAGRGPPEIPSPLARIHPGRSTTATQPAVVGLVIQVAHELARTPGLRESASAARTDSCIPPASPAALAWDT